MMPLNERTTYAIVVTKRLRDANGVPVGSPYKFANHASQTRRKSRCRHLSVGVTTGDVAFAFTFVKQLAPHGRLSATASTVTVYRATSPNNSLQISVVWNKYVTVHSSASKTSKTCMSSTRKTGTMLYSWYFSPAWKTLTLGTNA